MIQPVAQEQRPPYRTSFPGEQTPAQAHLKYRGFVGSTGIAEPTLR